MPGVFTPATIPIPLSDQHRPSCRMRGIEPHLSGGPGLGLVRPSSHLGLLISAPTLVGRGSESVKLWSRSRRESTVLEGSLERPPRPSTCEDAGQTAPRPYLTQKVRILPPPGMPNCSSGTGEAIRAAAHRGVPGDGWSHRGSRLEGAALSPMMLVKTLGAGSHNRCITTPDRAGRCVWSRGLVWSHPCVVSTGSSPPTPVRLEGQRVHEHRPERTLISDPHRVPASPRAGRPIGLRVREREATRLRRQGPRLREPSPPDPATAGPADARRPRWPAIPAAPLPTPDAGR